MKTLDELIESMQLTSDVNRHYREENADVLYYLVEHREYKKHMELVEQIHQDAVRQRDLHIRALVELKRKQDELEAKADKPLTWEELKQMLGKPVYIEFNTSYEPKPTRHWFIVTGFKTFRASGEEMLCEPLWHFSKQYFGDTWQAYRKEKYENAE